MDLELTEDQLDLQRRAREFVDTDVLPHYRSWPVTVAEYSPELVATLKERQKDLGLTNLIVPKEYGGQGLGAMEDALVLAEFSRSPRRIPGTIFAPWPVMYDAADPIKEKYLYPVLEGKTGWSMCFTEPGAGSDLAGIKTTAVRKGDHWVINGRKMWRTGHQGASYTAVAAVTDASKGARGISIFLVDNDTPGFEKARDIPVLSRTWGIEEEVALDNVVVPAENLLGEEGGGFQIAQHQFNRFRLRLGGLALGMSERSQQLAVDYARSREVFGGKLGDNQAIQWMLTDNHYDIESIRWNTYYAAWMVDRGGYSAARVQASMVKAYCIDAGLRVVDRSMQVLGGRGLAIEDYPFGDFYAQLRMCKQMEGSTEIMKIVMARDILGKKF
ncbi:alkylation response protein AidB-like acyl-CoA dehydrogenase [Antricoccus suffuscus]|uniref:Alkylation response protein AidB-like acyl-CoA dehydrogenase n=1 Tax=Antricoccus suffuscus TaxID=1629062 RepID=A0A2T0ZBM5_9ACTN|nr:acyl-CoA dehydrogenase family protein [Antricoccus suffuscus]PRZ33584.1 alkylation response protein AidB-like acyl-CoA dehydrogenase [Antricoccus suffuscus]